MAVNFLTVLLQTGEFVRFHQLNEQERNESFYSHSLGHLSPNRALSGARYILDKNEFQYGFIDLCTNTEMSTSSTGSNSTSSTSPDTADLADWLVFFTLETLGISGFIGNLALLVVIISSGLLDRPSFIFISSLAVGDVLHSTVTSAYFYPPIVLRRNLFNRAGIQLMNALDWTAWGITLTHMMAICLDRLLAIVLYQDYNRLVTVKRTMAVSLICWIMFAGVNILFTSMQLCCVVVPQPDFYTFGFEDSSVPSSRGDANITSRMNVYKPLYVPLECFAMLILAVGNPIILANLYEKYRKKRNLRAASVVLVEVGQSLCRQPIGLDASLARDVKIFLQIIIVTVIFFAYMFIYYLFFYITEFSDKWSTMLNSICYSITHMINPVIYFSLNEQMQRHVKNMISNISLVKRRTAARVRRRNALCGVTSLVQAISLATAGFSETSALMQTGLSSGADQETSRVQENLSSDELKVKLEENGLKMEELSSSLTPLLNKEGARDQVTQSYTEGGNMNKALGSCEYTTATYYFHLKPCDDDVFL